MAPSRTRRSREKPLAELKRPRRRLGDRLREVLNCPLCLCPGEKTSVIRWGERTTRFECRRCGLRFSLDLKQMAQALRRPKARPDLFEEGLPEPWISHEQEKSFYLAGGAAEELADFIDGARKLRPGDTGKAHRARANRAEGALLRPPRL
jgi:transcription elongation factor Elf1